MQSAHNVWSAIIYMSIILCTNRECSGVCALTARWLEVPNYNVLAKCHGWIQSGGGGGRALGPGPLEITSGYGSP